MAADWQIIPWNISGSNITVKQGACVGKMQMFICIYIRILSIATSTDLHVCILPLATKRWQICCYKHDSQLINDDKNQVNI